MLQVIGFDHFVLRVADVERSLAWWCGTLGLAGVRVDEWRRGEVPFPSVRIDDHTIVDLMLRRPADAPTDTRVLDHVCLVLAPGTDLSALAAALLPASSWSGLSRPPISPRALRNGFPAQGRE